MIVVVLATGAAPAVGEGPGGGNDKCKPKKETCDPPLEGVSCYTGQSAFEPSLGVTSNGTIFMESAKVVQRGVLLILELQRIVRSFGTCDNWKDVTQVVAAAGEEQSIPPQSNDPMVHVDPDTDRVFNLDMQGLSCNWLSFSDDFGDTWTSNPIACGQPPFMDHPTIFTGPARLAEDQAVLDAVGYPNIVYICVNQIVDSACTRSLDGGLTFDAWFVPPFGFACIGSGLHHFGVTDSEGRVFLAHVNGCTGFPILAVSVNDALSFSRVQITPGGAANRAFGHDVDIAIDEADNVYALWINQNDLLPRLAMSTDHGASWSTPITVTPPELEQTSFIALEAGAPGRVAISYYGTEDSPVTASSPWGAYITVSTNALDAAPTFETVPVNATDDPVARGPCDDANRCEPEDFGGSPGDFLDIVIDPDGRPWAAMVDVCNDACITGAAKQGDRAFAGTLQCGPALRGPSGQLPDIPDLGPC